MRPPRAKVPLNCNMAGRFHNSVTSDWHASFDNNSKNMRRMISVLQGRNAVNVGVPVQDNSHADIDVLQLDSFVPHFCQFHASAHSIPHASHIWSGKYVVVIDRTF